MPGPRRDRTQPSGLWRGRVTRIDAASGLPFVEVPRLARGFEFGPCEVALGLWNGGSTLDGGAGHTHPLGTPLAAGARVLAAFVEGRPDDVVITAVLP